MRVSYFIDESGNSGDLVRYNSILGFGDQPFFSLSAVGFESGFDLEGALARLRQKHRVQMAELKSSALWGRPDFLLDIVRLIRECERPYFIEIVDKKFFLCMNIMTTQLMRPSPGSPEGLATNYVRNELAEHLYRYAPGEVFESFVAAMKEPGDRTLREEFEILREFSRIAPSDGGRGEALNHSIFLAFEEYESEVIETEDAFYLFLPLPDASKHGKPVWLLPNLPSLLNIYARINLFENGSLSNVDLVHDEQAHFDQILNENKTLAESLSSSLRNLCTPHSDFTFLESASLRFERSAENLGIQVADILAGFCMRYTRALLEKPTRLSSSAHECFRLLLEGSDSESGVGINQIMVSAHARVLWEACHIGHN